KWYATAAGVSRDSPGSVSRVDDIRGPCSGMPGRYAARKKAEGGLARPLTPCPGWAKIAMPGPAAGSRADVARRGKASRHSLVAVGFAPRGAAGRLPHTGRGGAPGISRDGGRWDGGVQPLRQDLRAPPGAVPAVELPTPLGFSPTRRRLPRP